MVTITPITDARGARSYFEKDDYYIRDSSGGRAWMGKGAKDLGLTEVTPESFQAVLEGKDLDGNTLVQAASNGVHRAGWDFTFSPSKSVSLAWAFGNNEQRAAIMAAHNTAVNSTVKYIEDNLVQARVTVSGETTRIDTGNIIAARFDHFTTRELDPEMHTHLVIADVTRCPDGKYRAVANEKIFARELATAIYNNELAVELKENRFSITMKKYDTGNSRYTTIDGIDDVVTNHYSKRSDQIDKAIEPLKERYPNASREELRQIACLGTRQLKQTIDSEVLHVSWNQQLIDLGYSRKGISESIEKAYDQAKDMRTNLNPDEKEIVQMSCRVLNEQESTFTREDVLKTAARLSGGQHRISALERAFYSLKGSTIVTLDKIVGAYTTIDMKRIERGIVKAVKDGRDTIPAVLTIPQVEEQTLQLYGHLTSDQKKALEHILTTTDKVIGIQGDAGTGKTTMLNAAREQMEGQGYTVRGLTFTGKAAKELQTGAGVESKTLHSFLPQINSSEIVLSQKEAWFVDEVSMVGSRQMSELMKASKGTKARLVFVGDTKQLQSIDAGNMFKKLQETGAMKTVHMKETIRQKDEDYKAIVADLAEKRTDKAFEKLTSKSKIKEIADEKERHEAIVKRVVSSKDHKNILVVTPLNKDRIEINTQIREGLKKKGALKGDEHAFTVREPKTMGPAEKHFADSYARGDIIRTSQAIKGLKVGAEGVVLDIDRQVQSVTIRTPEGKITNINVNEYGHTLATYREKLTRFSEGEKIVFLKNDKNLRVQNGLTGEIKGIDARGYITVSIDNNNDIRWNIKHSYNYLDHGYAVTDYKSQGQTSRDVYYHANTERPTSYNSLYTGITRGRENVHVYTNDINKLKEQVKHEVRKTSSLDYDKIRDIPQASVQKLPVNDKTIPIGREGR
jgi:conjugative relaxase-like TrwC/TraI family protein